MTGVLSLHGKADLHYKNARWLPETGGRQCFAAVEQSNREGAASAADRQDAGGPDRTAAKSSAWRYGRLTAPACLMAHVRARGCRRS
jgi:hypothetical protein